MTDKSIIDPKKVQLLRLSNKVWFGCGAIHKIVDILEELKQKGHKKVFVVTGKSSYKACGAWEVVEKALKEQEMPFQVYDKITPNPLESQVEEGTKLASEFGADLFLTIGGGSVTDAAKAMATMVKYPENKLFDLYKGRKGFPGSEFIQALPLICINTTHGTGTEADRYSVVTFPKQELKQGTATESMYPIYSINDPNLLKVLPLNQTLYTALDAVNHANECATSVNNSLYSILLAREIIHTVMKYLPIAIKEPNNEEARYYLLYAAMLAGTGIDNGGCHITHGLEHVLSAIIPDLPHGLGLAMLLPAVQIEIYPIVWRILIDLFSPILPAGKEWGKDLKKEAVEFAKIIENWIFSLGVKEKLKDFGFEDKLDRIVKLGLGMRIHNSRLEETEEEVRRIYQTSMKPLP